MKLAILGAGAGACAAAADLKGSGFDLRMWSRNPQTIADIEQQGSVGFSGVLGEGRAMLESACSDLARTLSGADAVLVVLPTMLHASLGSELAELGWDRPVLLNPGHTGGGLAFRQAFIDRGRAPPPIAELSTLTYVARKTGPSEVSVTGKAAQVNMAALCDSDGAAMNLGSLLYPMAEPVANVLATGLMNVNLVLHTPGAILGAAWIEATRGDFTFYVEGMGEAVGNVMQALDRERLALANVFGIEMPDLFEEMQNIGTIESDACRSDGLVRAIREGSANARIRAPDNFAHRYYVEDVLYGLKPFVALAQCAAFPANTARSLLHIAEQFLSNPRFPGRDAAEMGISGMDRDAVLDLVGG